MDWGSIGTQIILGIVGILITGLGTVVTYLINKYVKNDKLNTILKSLSETITNSVLEVYQTYVQALKDGNMFDETAQKEALDKAIVIIKNNLPVDVMKWVKENYTDIDAYFKSQIEAVIGLLKNGSKTVSK